MKEKKYNKKENNISTRENLLFSLSLIGEIGFITALPLVAFGLLGRYLDRQFGTSPYLFLICLAIATILIFFSLRNIIKKYIEEFDRMNK